MMLSRLVSPAGSFQTSLCCCAHRGISCVPAVCRGGVTHPAPSVSQAVQCCPVVAPLHSLMDDCLSSQAGHFLSSSIFTFPWLELSTLSLFFPHLQPTAVVPCSAFPSPFFILLHFCCYNCAMTISVLNFHLFLSAPPCSSILLSTVGKFLS